MKIENLSLKDFRKRYGTSEKFLIRIREHDDDIIYYNGIKAFVIDKESKDNNIIIKLPENIYKLNRSNIMNNKSNIDDLLKKIGKVREDMQKYIPAHIETIQLKIGSPYFKGDYLSIQKKAEDILTNINKELSKFNLEMNINNIKNDIEKKCNKQLKKYLDKHPELEEKLKPYSKVFEKINYLFANIKNDDLKPEPFKVTVDTGLEINKTIDEDLEIEKIFILNTIFNDKLQYDKNTGFCKPIVKFRKEDDLNNFETSIKTAIENYEKNTGEELEKKYQHQFMLSNNILKKFESLKIDNLIRFEEEYYIKDGDDKNDNDNGRLDCIFIRPEEQEVYLIELKVNDSVIGVIGEDEHGIDKHLEDITNLCNNKQQLNDAFLTKLINKFEYTEKELFDKDYHLDINKIKVYFYTIVAITPDYKDNAKKVNNKIEAMYETDKNKYALLNPDNPSVTIENCEMKILFDTWDKEINDNDFMTYKEFLAKYIKK